MKVWNGSSTLSARPAGVALPEPGPAGRTLVLAFGSPEGEGLEEAVGHVVATYPDAVVVGCSTSGEISGTAVHDDSLAISVASFDATEVRKSVVEVEDPAHSAQAGAALGRALAGPGLRAVFVLSDGLGVNGSELVRGLNGALPDGVVVTGGLAGDGTRFEKTWVLADGVMRSKVVVGVGLYGDRLQVGHGSKGGWDAFGPERIITRSAGNVLFELDGKPALDLYKQYLGAKAAELPSSGLLFPLALRDPNDREKVLVRTLLAVDEEARSMTFAGDLPEGHTVQLMKADFDRLVEGASQAASIADRRADGDCLVVAVSCVGRRLVLGERLEEELEAIQDVVDTENIVGFYSYGELSPFGQGSCDLHNQTMTLRVFSEGEVAAEQKPARGGMELARLQMDVKRGTWDARIPTHLDSPHTLVTVFADARLAPDADALKRVQRAFPTSHVLGCSGAGEIHGTTVRDGSVSMSVARFAKTRLRSASAVVSGPEESHAIGARIASELVGDGLRAIFVLSDGLNMNGSELVRGINGVVGPDVVVTGGLAGDGTRFEKTWVLAGKQAGPNLVGAVGLYGDHVVVQHGSLGGWDAFGPVRTVTRAKDNVLFELDGKPALDLYKQYLGEKAAELPASGLLFPLALTSPDNPGKVLVRTLLAVDEATRSMTFAGDLPEGHRVQLMKADFDRLVAGARGAASAATFDPDLLDGSASLAIAVSCVGRRLVLGEQIEEEVEAIEEALPFVDHITGFYSYGELSPSVESPSCDLHNQTMTLTTFGESVEPLARGMEVVRSRQSLDDGSWSTPLPTRLDGPQTLVVVFGSPDVADDPASATAIAAAFPRSVVVGCSTAGEIHQTQVDDRSLSVAVTRFQHTRLRVASTPVSAASASYGAGQKVARELAAPDLRAVFVLSDGLGVNGSELVRGLNATLGDDVVVTGGLAGDGTRFERTWVLADGTVEPNRIVAVGLYGDHLEVHHGSMGGWDQFGPVRTITRSDGNVLYELDDKPALALYKQYLGDKAAELPSSGLLFPLALRKPGEDKVLVRTLLAVDEAAQSMTFAGDLPVGHTVQLMKADFDRLVDGAAEAADRSKPSVGGPCLTLAISCVGRRLVLGERIEEEVEAVQEHLGDRAEIVGFYSYGELSPAIGSETCDLHNQTMTLTTFSESPVPLPRRRVPRGMTLETVTWRDGRWSGPLPVELDGPQTLVMAFGPTAVMDDPTPVQALREAFPRARIIGCSTSGEIHETTVSDDVLTVSVARFQHTALRSATVAVPEAGRSFHQGRALAAQLAQDDLRALFVLSDGLTVNGSELVRGINQVVGDGVVVTGGLAGDGTRFERTWVADAEGVAGGRVTAVGFYGDRIQLQHGSLGGWDAFGPERTVTRASANVLFELDGKPALDLYKTYLGDKAGELPASGLLFPLALRTADAPGKTLVRTLLAVDEDARSMTFAGDLPEGGTVQLMKADFDRLVDGARDAAAATGFGAASAAPGSHALAVAVSCVGRRLVLGERTEEELEAVRRTLPEVQHIAGFFSYGELSPAAGSASCDLHNQTMTLTVFSEAAEDLPARVVAAKPAPTDDFAGKPLFQLPDEAGTPTVLQRRHTPPTTAGPVLPEPEPPTASGQDFGFDFGFDAFDGTGSMEPAAPPPGREEPRKPAAETPRPAAAAPRKRTTLKRVHQPRANLLTDIRRGGEYQILTLAGRMSEGFEGAELGRKLVGKVVVDLHGVERVTSFGVRGWLDMLREMDVDALYFVRCSEAIVNQLGMIRNFCGPGKVVSFFAPYACPACGLEFNALYDAIGDRKAIDAHNPFDVECPACSRAGVFDDDPWSYFAMNAELAESVDPALAEALTRLTPMGDASDPVQKEIEGQETVIRINARLDENLRLRRVLDGLEGRVVFDMTGVQGSSPAGVRGFASALQRLDPGISEVVLAGCPEALLELLMREPLQARMRIASVMVTGICPDNRTSRQVFVDLEAHADEILAGQTPRLRCEWCTSPVDIQSVLPLLARCLSRDTAGHTVSPDPVPVEVDAAPVAPAPVLPPPPAPSVSPWTVMLGGIAGAALLSTGVLATLLAVTAFAPDGPPPTAEPVAAVLQPPTPAPAQQLGWEGGASLPPGWTEQPFALTATEAAVVGSGSGATVEEAAEAARIAAHTALVERLQDALKGSLPYELLQGAGPAAGDPKAVVAAFLEQSADVGTPTRKDTAIRHDADGKTVVARYTLPREAWDAVVERYRAVESFRGMDVARVFPTLRPRLGDDASLVVVRTSRWLREVNPEDVVLAVDGQGVYSLADFREKAEDAWRRVPEGRSVNVEVAANGLRREVGFRKPEAAAP